MRLCNGDKDKALFGALFHLTKSCSCGKKLMLESLEDVVKLWVLRPWDANKHPFKNYDTNQGFVVRAETESKARTLAASQTADEGRHNWVDGTKYTPWLDEHATTCKELTSDGEASIIMRDFAAG